MPNNNIIIEKTIAYNRPVVALQWTSGKTLYYHAIKNNTFPPLYLHNDGTWLAWLSDVPNSFRNALTEGIGDQGYYCAPWPNNLVDPGPVIANIQFYDSQDAATCIGTGVLNLTETGHELAEAIEDYLDSVYASVAGVSDGAENLGGPEHYHGLNGTLRQTTMFDGNNNRISVQNGP